VRERWSKPLNVPKNETKMTMRCKCGEAMQIPTPEEILALMSEFGFSAVTIEIICPNCNKLRFTSYRTGNGQKGIDNQRR